MTRFENVCARRTGWFGLAAFVLSTAMIPCCDGCGPGPVTGGESAGNRVMVEAPSRPDVVFLSIDTLRADHVGAFSDRDETLTPRIDALARQGTRYTQAWSPVSNTAPAFATVHTGQEPGAHGVLTNQFRGGEALASGAETLAEVLGSHGYATGAFVSGFTVGRRSGLDQGFDAYRDTGEQLRRSGDDTARLAVDWLEAQSGPIFLWLHLYDPHGPLDRWTDVPAGAERWLREPANLGHVPRYQRIDGITDPGFYAARYASAVRFADEQLGTVVRSLERTGRFRGAMIVVLADHGESFDERSLWFDHGTTAYAEQLRVPLVVRYPGGDRSGVRTDALVGLADVAPTVLDVLRLPGLADADGRSLISGAGPGRSVVLGESGHCKSEEVLDCAPVGLRGKMIAARDSKTTVVRRSTARGPVIEVYDRRADPRELSPLPATAAPAGLLTAMEELARSRQLAGEEAPDGGAAPIPRGVEQALRGLGYLQ